MEMGARPTPLAVPGAKPSPCQKRAGPKPHMPNPAAPGPDSSTAKEAKPNSSVLGASRGCSAGTATPSHSNRPRSAPGASPAAVSREPLQWSPHPGLAESNPPSAKSPDRSTSISTHCVVPHRHTRGRGRKSPSGVTALLGMPGGQIPPLTPTPGTVTSWLSSPMP